MGGWSGGVYTRFRNWVSDKANSINPQAALFDQEDDGFAAGLNNCVTKDGLNKPSSAMDWNGQNLTGVLNFANTGTVSLVGGKWTISLNGNFVGTAPTSGIALSVSAAANATAISVIDNSVINSVGIGLLVNRPNGSTGNAVGQGSAIQLNDAALPSATIIQNSGGQTEIWQSGTTGGFHQVARFLSSTTAAGKVPQILDDTGTMQPVGYRGIPPNIQSANYVFVLADRARAVRMTGSTGQTVTLNTGIFSDGDIIILEAFSGTNTYTIVQGAGVGLFWGGNGATTGNRTIASVSNATIKCVGSNNFIISGPGLT